MILAQWLDARRPDPPLALRTRIDAALGGELRHEPADTAETLLAAGERLARALLAEGASTRDAALDLLAADALVTYAFEAASEHPAELSSRARSAMARIADLGAAHESRGLA
jgi:hypothetical protein